MDRKLFSLRCDRQSNIQHYCGLRPCVTTPASGRSWLVTIYICIHVCIHTYIYMSIYVLVYATHLHTTKPILS